MRDYLEKLWKQSRFDADCSTIEEYAERVCERLHKLFGIDVTDLDLDQLGELMWQLDNE